MPVQQRLERQLQQHRLVPLDKHLFREDLLHCRRLPVLLPGQVEDSRVSSLVSLLVLLLAPCSIQEYNRSTLGFGHRQGQFHSFEMGAQQTHLPQGKHHPLEPVYLQFVVLTWVYPLELHSLEMGVQQTHLPQGKHHPLEPVYLQFVVLTWMYPLEPPPQHWYRYRHLEGN